MKTFASSGDLMSGSVTISIRGTPVLFVQLTKGANLPLAVTGLIRLMSCENGFVSGLFQPDFGMPQFEIFE